MLAPKPNAHCSLKDKNKDERTKHSTGLSFRNLQGQQWAQACSQKTLFYGSELKVEWATPEVVSFPSQGVFKQIFPIPRFDPVSLFPGVSGLSRPHTPPCSTSIYPTHWTVLPSSDLSAFNHTAPSAEMSMSPFCSSGLQTGLTNPRKHLSFASHTPSRSRDISFTLACNQLCICLPPCLPGDHPQH